MQNNGNELNTVNLIIPRSVSCFAPNIFHNGPCIEEITFQKPSHIENLCNRVFYGRTSLKEIEIPASTSERPIVIPQAVKVIGKNIFEKCDSLVSVLIPSSLQNK
ncbi:hypothetical protein M9Y10_024888 [Tritrichomonas musculus]|uniref:Uncharacterized protein n=1 Tax=Tritrichomonas musculus TaxID=1915356 RepID=A0ABR2HCC0_9EUKA